MEQKKTVLETKSDEHSRYENIYSFLHYENQVDSKNITEKSLDWMDFFSLLFIAFSFGEKRARLSFPAGRPAERTSE